MDAPPHVSPGPALFETRQRPTEPFAQLLFYRAIADGALDSVSTLALDPANTMHNDFAASRETVVDPFSVSAETLVDGIGDIGARVVHREVEDEGDGDVGDEQVVEPTALFVRVLSAFTVVVC